MKKMLLLLLLTFMLLHPHAVICQICFTDNQYIPVYSWPTYIATADLNNDSFPDLVTASMDYSNVIAVFMNNGDKTFSPPVYYAPENTPTQICIEDMNSDDIPDLVVGMRIFGFNIFFGLGDGSFDSPVYYYTGYWTSAIIVDDLNGDSIPDVATTCTWDDSLRIYTGDNQGIFTFAGVYSSGGNTPTVIHTGDFDHNNIVDLAVLNCGDAGAGYRNVAVFLGLGAALFDVPDIYSLYIEPTSIDVADFNKDSADDFVVGQSLHWPQLLFGIGDGTFDNSGYQDTVGLGTQNIFSGDINMDGIPDLITPDCYVSVALGYGDGTFSTSENLPSNYNYCAAYYGCMADFDRDGRNDLAAVKQNAYEFYQPGMVAILYNCINVGLEDRKNSETASVFPNPANGEIRLNIPENVSCEHIQIINSFQQIVLDEPFSSDMIDVRHLTSGVYSILLYSNGCLVGQYKFIRI